jgi:hypothetical protein
VPLRREDTDTERSSVRREIMEDYEYTAVIEGLEIFVNKVGGGTLGKSYDGNWEVTVKNGDEFVYDRSLLWTGVSKTHQQAAQYAFDYASAEIEEQS